jgi:L-gulonate 3-dehydrogenase
MASVAIIGAGIIGSSWAIVFARAGLSVQVFDHRPANLAAFEGRVRTAAEAAVAISRDDPAALMARVAVADNLAGALVGADYVQECIIEDVDAKAALFAELDHKAAPDAILASSTSSIGISRFTRELNGRDRCIVVHPATPPHLLPAVEVVPAPWTPQATVDRVFARMHRVGQAPVLIRRETPGFVMNRLQGALLIEVFRAVSDGLINATDADTLIRDGFGLRWSFLGPLQGIDLNAPAGIADYLARYGFMFENLARERADDRRPVLTPVLVEALDQAMRRDLPLDGLAARRLWRDERIAALRALREDDP